MSVIQIRRDGLYHQESAVYARTELSPQKHVRDSVSQKIFTFDPFVQCEDKDAEVWISKEELVPQSVTDHHLAVHVSYSKPQGRGEFIPFKVA